MKRPTLGTSVFAISLAIAPVLLYVFVFGVPRNHANAAAPANELLQNDPTLDLSNDPPLAPVGSTTVAPSPTPRRLVSPSAVNAGSVPKVPQRGPGAVSPLSALPSTSPTPSALPAPLAKTRDNPLRSPSEPQLRRPQPTQQTQSPITLAAQSTATPVAAAPAATTDDELDFDATVSDNLELTQEDFGAADPYQLDTPALTANGPVGELHDDFAVPAPRKIEAADDHHLGMVDLSDREANYPPAPRSGSAAPLPGDARAARPNTLRTAPPNDPPSDVAAIVTPQNASPLTAPDPSATAVPVLAANPKARPVPSQSAPKVAGSSAFSNTRNENRSERLAAEMPRSIEGTGTPGPQQLDGPQMPQLILEKVAPQEVQLGRPVVFKTVVRNVGKATAKEIVLRDAVPQGTRLVSTQPSVSPQFNGELTWSLGSLNPNEEISVEMEVIPNREGEFGSVATVQFAAEASGRTVATQAMLELEIAPAEPALLGEKAALTLVLSNPGSGTASGIVLELQVPDGLAHEKGREIKVNVGDLKPKETKRFPLSLQCLALGRIAGQIKANGNNQLESVAAYAVDVLGPELMLQISGPKQRYLERKAVYTLSVANPGTASAYGVALTAHLPTGLQFVSTNQNGLYDAGTHTVHWALEELPAQDAGEIELIALPVRQGEHTIRFEGIGQKNLKAETSHAVSISGLPALSFEVFCLSDPVEIGKPATYEVKLTNRGTKASQNVAISVRLSEGMQFANAEGPTKHRVNGGVIQFDSLDLLDPKQEKTYKFTARCLASGDHRVSVSLLSDELRAPVTKEESTQVFGDQ